MKRTIFLLVLSAIWMCSAADEGKEPPLQYTLTINGEAYPITLDQSIELRGTFNNPTISISAAKTRGFRAGGVEFQYPAAFIWEARTDSPGSRRWVLSGNSFKIIYVATSGELTLDSYVESMAVQMGKESVQIVETERQLGDVVYQGKHLSANLVGYDFEMEVYAFPGKNSVRFLVLQGSLPASEAESAEREQALQLLRDSFCDTENSQ